MPHGILPELEGRDGVNDLPGLGKIADISLKVGTERDQPGINHPVELELTASVDDIAILGARGIGFTAAAAGCSSVKAQGHLALRGRGRNKRRVDQCRRKGRAESKRGRALDDLATGHPTCRRIRDQCVDSIDFLIHNILQMFERSPLLIRAKSWGDRQWPVVSVGQIDPTRISSRTKRSRHRGTNPSRSAVVSKWTINAACAARPSRASAACTIASCCARS